MTKPVKFTSWKTCIGMMALATILSACTGIKSKKAENSSKPQEVVKTEENIADTTLGVAKAVIEAIPGISEFADTNDETKFSSKEYGVAGSPRMSNHKLVRKGGGRYQIGKPYTVRGKRYHPRADENYKAVGLASWYGPNFHGRLTANGEIYDQYSLSAAHPTLPLPSYVKVTNLENGSSVVVRVNDRGPFSKKRVIDLSARAAQLLGYTKQGVAKVKVEYAGKAPLHGLDEQQLLASYNSGTMDPRTIPPNGRGTVLLAQAKPNSQRVTRVTQAFVPPIPKSKPFFARPQGLVNSYSSDVTIASKSSPALAWFNATDQQRSTSNMASPTIGMDNISRISFGPFKSMLEYNRAEKILSDYGYASFSTNQTSSPILILTTANEDRSSAKKAAKRASIQRISSQ